MRRRLVRIGPFSARLDVRSIGVSTVLAGVILVLFCWTISVGAQGASLAAVSVIVLGGSGDVLGGVASIGVPIAALLGGRCGDPRRVAGPGQVALVPSALMGSAVVLASELIARRILAPTELPVGIVTSIIGAPYLLYLLWTANTIRRSG